MKSKVKIFSYYSRSFFYQLITRSFFWITFIILFTKVGKKYLDTDILGKIYHSIFGRERNFNQYFIGANIEEKSKLLNYAYYFILSIIALNSVAVFLNFYLWRKDRFIENNNFYLHNRWIFLVNSLITIASVFLLTFSFVSSFTVIITLIFLTFNNWKIINQKKLEKPQLENHFSWEKSHIRNVLFYSSIIILILPFSLGRLQELYREALSNSPSGFAKTLKDLIKSNETIEKFIEMILGAKANFEFLHWFILILFTQSLIKERIKKFNDFWSEINNIEERVITFKHYYYYQESWALTNNLPVDLGDYSYLKNSPKFSKNLYLEKKFDVRDFAKNNQKVIKYIEFCQKKVKENNKRNFLYYCLFNDFNSEEDYLRTKKLIRKSQ